MTRKLEGAMTALITPMRDGRVDEAALEELVEMQLQGGIDALIPCGTTGEAATLSDDEYRAVIERTVKTVRGRVPVIAGAGSYSTADAVARGEMCRAAGADALLVVTPYYNRPPQEGLYRHFRAVAEAVPLPIVTYNVPARCGVDLAVETLERLAELPNIVAIKEATGLVTRTQQIVARLGERITVLCGDDAVNYPLYAVGARGCISVVSNAAPKLIADGWDAVTAGDHARARALHERSLALCEALFSEPNPIPVKFALSHLTRGRIANELRLPLVPATPQAEKRVLQALAQLS